MGKGMGAVDKNMRKELSLEIDGHASAAAHESNVAARRMAPTPSRRRQLDRRDAGSILTHAGVRINTSTILPR